MDVSYTVSHEVDTSRNLQLANRQSTYFSKGFTQPYSFRIQQLRKLLDIINRHENEILDALKKDLNKPTVEAYASDVGFVKGELQVAIKNLKRWMAPRRVRTSLINQPGRSYVLPQARGVSLIIAPWNYPFNLIMAPLVANIAAGNTAILKPAEQTPHTAELLYRMINQHFEPDYISVVLGDGVKVIPPLMANFRFDHVFFTGSTDVGRQVAEMAARKLTPVTLELGGKSPAIIDSSANIKVTAKRVAFGKFFNAGQTCIAPDYVLVHHTIKDEFLLELTKALTSFYNGEANRGKHYARIATQDHFKRLAAYLKDGDVVYGGEMDEGGYFFSPTVITNVDLDAPIMTEEIFGPILPVISYNDDAEAIDVINRNPYPLALYLFANDRKKEELFINNLRFGGGSINNTLVHFVESGLHFGGVGTSGYGTYHGKSGFETFSHHKAIIKSATWFDPNFKYPPYSDFFLKLVKRLIG